VAVTGVRPGPVVSRISTNARFRIECEGGVPDGLPADLCVKGYFTEVGWPARKVGAIEVGFYRELADRVGVRTPRGVYAAVDEETGHGVVITEDVVAAGSVFLDASSPYTPGQTADSLAELARLHAATWGDPAVRGRDWLASRLASHQQRGVDVIQGNYESEIGPQVPAEVRHAERLYAAYAQLAERARKAAPWAVVHGDAHIGNVYLDGRGRPSFIDWQLVQRGPWYLDVGYHLAATLTVEDRRRTEDDLLRGYLERLCADGVVEAPAWDEARRDVRDGMLHGFYLWSITQKVDRGLTGILLHRLGTAVADHDALTTAE
jgi:hypothetical protein